MRYIGNKTKLLDFIGSALDDQEIAGGRAFDAFSGTASVGRYLKRRGFSIISCDVMTYSLVFQKAYIEVDRVPCFERVLIADGNVQKLAAQPHFASYVESRFRAQGDLFVGTDVLDTAATTILGYLERFLPPLAGFITRHYAPSDETDKSLGRMFFTVENASRIDAVRTKIHEWRVGGLLDDEEYFFLLASLLEGADAVANTTGVYAAYVKSWQSNALRPIRLDAPDVVHSTGQRCVAIQGHVNDVVRGVGRLNLLYLDPPYNTRQYSSYYHVPEIIARGWFEDEPEIRGKTGLIPDQDKKSSWSTKGGCVAALADLLEHADTRHILLSYNSEGIIPEDDIRRIFCTRGRPETFRIYELDYARYRADSDHEMRQYKADRVTEKLYYVEASRN